MDCTARGEILAGLLTHLPGTPHVIRRCTLDSIPKLRGAVIRYLDGEGSAADTTAVGNGVVHPTRTVRRALEDLTAHGVEGEWRDGSGKAAIDINWLHPSAGQRSRSVLMVAGLRCCSP
jgi:hypothetical protein